MLDKLPQFDPQYYSGASLSHQYQPKETMLACSETKLHNYSTEITLHNIHRKRTIKTDLIHNYVFVRNIGAFQSL